MSPKRILIVYKGRRHGRKERDKRIKEGLLSKQGRSSDNRQANTKRRGGEGGGRGETERERREESKQDVNYNSIRKGTANISACKKLCAVFQRSQSLLLINLQPL